MAERVLPPPLHPPEEELAEVCTHIKVIGVCNVVDV
jgi:P2-related tail formation protein